MKEKWEREATVIMDLAEEYPSIILQLGAVSSRRTERVAPVKSVYFISPAYKNIQTLCMISGLINNSIEEQKAAVSDNIEILLEPSLEDEEEEAEVLYDEDGDRLPLAFATYNSARFYIVIKDMRKDISAHIKTKPDEPLDKDSQDTINNLIDMINSSNGYDINNEQTGFIQEPGMVVETYLEEQMNNRNLVTFVPYPIARGLPPVYTTEIAQKYFGDEEGKGGLLNDAINRNKRYSRLINTAEKLVLDTQFKTSW